MKSSFKFLTFLLRMVYQESPPQLKFKFRTRIFTFLIGYLRKPPKPLDWKIKTNIVVLLIEILHRSQDIKLVITSPSSTSIINNKTNNIDTLSTTMDDEKNDIKKMNSNTITTELQSKLLEERPSLIYIDWMKSEIGILYELLFPNTKIKSNLSTSLP